MNPSKVRPGVEVAAKVTTPSAWSVNGVSRGNAVLVSRDSEDRPVYGGTPADFAVVQAIREIRARGLRVTLYPFLLMGLARNRSLNGSRLFPPALHQNRDGLKILCLFRCLAKLVCAAVAIGATARQCKHRHSKAAWFFERVRMTA